jgi:hypothetical protein
MDIKGTVTINLSDYHTLIDSHPKVEQAQEKLRKAAKEIEIFLSFICEREDMGIYIEEYNKQAVGSKIVVINDKVKIQFNEENNNKGR